MDTSWQEAAVTWNNAPPAESTLLASLGTVSPGNWYEVDLTSIVTSDGTYSISVSSANTNGADYASRESANAPQLIVTLQETTEPTPTPEPTETMEMEGE